MHRPQILSHRTALGGGVMKAAVVPAVSSSWQIKDVPQPQPGPNQVLVKMHASGICYTDVHLTLGHFPGPFPRILGHERVAVLGIGGLGHLAVQYAKAAGFEAIAISHSPDKDKLIRDLGADEIVRDGKSLAAAGGADIILSTSNSTKSMVDSIQGLRPDGRLITMGADAEPLTISLMDLISKRIRVIGSQQNGSEYLYEALDFVAQGKVKTIVETYPLAEAPKAYQRVVEGKARFRAVLTM